MMIAGVIGAVLLVALLMLYGALRRSQRATDDLANTIERLIGGDMTAQANPPNQKQLARLTQNINRLAAQLRQNQTALVQRETDLVTTKEQAHHLAHTIIPLSLALTAEKDYARLLRMILSAAQSFCHADAGTLYLRTADDHLDPVMLQNISLGLLLDGTGGEMMPIPPLALYDSAGQPNQRNITTYTAHSGNAINVGDVYSEAAAQYDFSGPKAFDLTMDYRSQSFLTIPLKYHDGSVIGVLQLINAHDPHSHQVISFSPEVQEMAEALAALAAAALIVVKRDQTQRQALATASEVDLDFED
jgi:GAF domain-containing protein